MAVSNKTDDRTRSSIANVLNEVNEFIDGLDREEVRGEVDVDVVDHHDGPPESGVPLSISMIDNQHMAIAAGDHRDHDDCKDYGDDYNAIHDSEELFSSLSSRYQKMMNLETRIDNESNVQTRNDGDENEKKFNSHNTKPSFNDQLGYEHEICGVRQKSTLRKNIDVIDCNGVAGGESETDNDRPDYKSGGTSIDIRTDTSIAHSAGGSFVENVPPSHRLQHQQSKQRWQQQQEQQPQKPLFPHKNQGLDKKDNMSPLQPSMATTLSPSSSSSSTTSRIHNPFSAKSCRLVQTNHDLASNERLPNEHNGQITFSLQNCRKVSLLLKVNFVATEDAEDQVEDDEYGPILFPALTESREEGIFYDAAELDRAEVILVKPKAFEGEERGGKKEERGFGETSKDPISGRVTVETARLVAEVSQISSEDWARSYKFDAVCWSNKSDSHSYNSLSALASAAVEDVLSLSLRPKCALRDDSTPCSTIIFAFGGTASGKTQTIFGSSIAALLGIANNKAGNGHELGLLGDIMNGLLSSQHLSGHEGHKMSGSSSDPAIKCSISILEIVNEDVLRDVLGSSNEGLGEHGGSKALRVRHSDGKGATVSNLREATCESIDNLHELLFHSFKSQNLRRAWNNEGGHGHFIVNVNIVRPSGGCAKIQLVDLASPDRRAANAASLRSVRKSLSALRGVLRGVAMQHVNQDSASLKSPIPYRESTLTKLLQRSFDHHDGIRAWTRAVVIGTVRPSTKTYNQTLGTIDFMTRILAKAGETAHSPFRDGSSASNRARQSNKLDGNKKRTSHCHDNGELDNSQVPPQNSSVVLHTRTALMSITSDPRQRLARLVKSTPLSREDSNGASRKSDDALSNNGAMVDNTESAHQRGSNYGRVLDQLDSLMDAEDNDLDRKGYGEGLIEALTPHKSKVTCDESSIDSSNTPGPSPFRDSRSAKANEAGIVRLLQKNKSHGSRESSKLNTSEAFIQSTLSASHKASQIVRGKSSALTHESEAERFALFPKVSDPPRIILPLESLDSEEPLVSSRGQDLFFGDSVFPRENNSVFQLAKNSPTYEMFESFKQEIDTLVASLTPRQARNESDKTQMLDVPGGPSDDTNTVGISNADQTCILLEAEVTSLNAKVQSLIKEKSALEALLSKIHSVVKEDDSKQFSLGSSMPPKYNELLSAITDRQKMLFNLESQLETSKAECATLSSELNRAKENASNLSEVVKEMERDLVEAHGKNLSHAEAASLLESHNMQLVKTLENMRDKETASSTFFNQLDDILGIKKDDLHDNDETRNKLRFRCIETLKTELQDGLSRLKESSEREQQARNNVDQVNSQIYELKIREEKSHEALSQLEAKRIGTEKLAEKAISANEDLNNQLADLRNKLAQTQKDYEMLSSAHKSALGESQTLRSENEILKSHAVKHEYEIVRLNSALAARRDDESQRDIASFKAKTIAVMKQHMEGLKVDYAKRLEDFKSSYMVEKETDEFSRLQLDISKRQRENEILKRRIEQLEKSSSSQLQNAETNLSRMREETLRAKEDASKQRDLNKKIQGELDHLRSLMDIAEESVSELSRLKEENERLNETLKTLNEHDRQLSTTDEDHFMHERISTLMRENEQNNISMRTLQAENDSLKRSIEQCTSTIQIMYSEMSDLKAIAINGISKLRTKEKSLLDDQQKSRGVIAEMEDKLENANNFIRLLQASTGQSPIPTNIPNVFDRPTTPFVPRSSQLDNFNSLPRPGSSSIIDRQYASELSTEKELRCKAEEICAGVLADSRAALEERDTEISNLRKQLFRLSGQRYNR